MAVGGVSSIVYTNTVNVDVYNHDPSPVNCLVTSVIKVCHQRHSIPIYSNFCPTPWLTVYKVCSAVTVYEMTSNCYTYKVVM